MEFLAASHSRFLIAMSCVVARVAGGTGLSLTRTAYGPDTTILRYEAKAAIGGKLAHLGSRFMQSTAKTLAAKIFYHARMS